MQSKAANQPLTIVTGSATKDQAIAQLQKELQDTASVVTGG